MNGDELYGFLVTQESPALNGRKRSSQDVANALRARIDAGELRAGDRMPTQAELADEFHVERGTIRQALRILQDAGLLTDVARGAPARIADRAAGHVAHAGEEPQPTMVALAPRIATAFAVPDVRIDVISLTAESLMLALGEPLRLIHAGRIRPDRVHVRVLLPSRDIDLAFPAAVAGPAGGSADDNAAHDHAVHERWLLQRNSQGQVLRHNLLALRGTHGIDVTVSFKALPFTPPVKLYVLNGSEALFAYYRVTRREEEIGDEPVELYDALGTQSLLFSFERRAGAQDHAFVEESQKWFDALWNTIASDLTLS